MVTGWSGPSCLHLYRTTRCSNLTDYDLMFLLVISVILHSVEFLLGFLDHLKTWPTIFPPKRRWWRTIARSVISQRSSGLVYFAAEDWNKAFLLVEMKNTKYKRNTDRHSFWQKIFSWVGRNNLILLGRDAVILWRNSTICIFRDNNLKPETELLETYDAGIAISQNVGSYLTVEAVWNPWRPQPSTTLM